MAQLGPEKIHEHRRHRAVRRPRNPRGPHHSGTFDLRNEFPIAYRVVLKRSFTWLAGWMAILGMIVLVQALSTQNIFGSAAGQLFMFGFGAITAVLAIKLTYEFLYRASYYYAIEAGHLVVSKGIIIRQRGSFPLSRITDVYLDRTVSDFVFGLYDLHVSTPTVDSGRFARICGLPRDSAVRLQRSLVSLIESTHSDEGDQKRPYPREQKAEKAVHED